MTKVHLLGANRSYDRDIQTVSVNQIVVLEGYAGGSYVVYDVTHNQIYLSSCTYKNLRLQQILQCQPCFQSYTSIGGKVL